VTFHGCGRDLNVGAGSALNQRSAIESVPPLPFRVGPPRTRSTRRAIIAYGTGLYKVAGAELHGMSAQSFDELFQAIAFDDAGLVPAIAQQHDTGEVLMQAWMNREAVAETLRTGRVCYWSRSRRSLWRKGEISGQVQRLVELRLDCDGDTLLLLVDQTGVACHTGRRSCFFRAVRDGRLVEIAVPEVAPEALYGGASRE
jgi:phosphoribosyl-AMP cyclohydrolase